MSIHTTIVALEKYITRSATKFTDARTRRPAFAPYPTAAALRTILTARTSLGAADRSALLCALLSEQQQARHTLWQALLLVAFEPMLLRLRSQIRRRPDEDADQAVIIAFLEATTTVPIGPFAPLALLRMTEETVLFAKKRARREPKVVDFDEETHPHPATTTDPDARLAAAEIVQIVEKSGGKELVDVILTTAAEESLSQIRCPPAASTRVQ